MDEKSLSPKTYHPVHIVGVFDPFVCVLFIQLKRNFVLCPFASAGYIHIFDTAKFRLVLVVLNHLLDSPLPARVNDDANNAVSNVVRISVVL